ASAPNVRGISNLRPGAPAISSGSSLVVIGHRGGSGRASAQNHGSIKVFSTPPAATAPELQQPRQTASAASRAAYNYQKQGRQPRAARDRQRLRRKPNARIP